MTDEEKAQVKANIDRRNELARLRYKNNKEQREKQIERVKARRKEMKKSSKEDNSA